MVHQRIKTQLVVAALQLLILVLVCAIDSIGQDVRFRRVSLEQGLPQSYVNHIAEDADGFLWVATQDGLGRYDGRTMDVYRHRPGDPFSIAGNNVYRLVLGVDRRMHAWTAGGHSVFNSRSGRWSQSADTSMVDAVRSHPLQRIDDGVVNVTYTDRRGRLWVGTVQKGLVVTDPGERYRSEEFSTAAPEQRRLPVNDVWAMCEDRNGRMWVGLNGGGVVVIQDMQIVARYQYDAGSNTSLSSNVVRVLYQDAIGTMWVGTHGGGLCQYDPYAHAVSLLRPSVVRGGATDNFTRAIAKYDSASLVVGLRTGILRTNHNLSRATMIAQWESEYNQIGAARALVFDRFGQLWVGSERKGVGILKPGARTIRWLPVDPRYPYRRTVHFLAMADDDHVIVGTDDGIGVIAATTLQQEWYGVQQSPDPENPRVAISSIALLEHDRELWKNDLLIGTEYGLYRGPLGGPYRQIICRDSLAVRPNINIIRTLEVDQEVVYAATWGGGIRVINLRDGTERIIDSRHGLPSTTVYAAYVLPNQQLVASTNAGIVLWDVALNRLVRHITPHHGAQDYEFNSWSHSKLGPDRFAFGGISGVNVISIADLPVPPAPRVVVEHADEERITARAIALSATDVLRYRYKLHHNDSAWTTASAVDVVPASLSPGSYVLQVQAGYATRNHAEPLAYGPLTTYAFVVPVPVWQSWWAIGAGLLGTTGVVWSMASRVARRRAQRHLEKEQALNLERVRIARDLHDDVGTGLAKIVILAEQTNRDAIREIATTAQEVIDSVRSIVWVMKSSDTRLGTTIGYVQSKVADLMQDAGIAFRYEELGLGEFQLDALAMRNIVLAVKEIATNIVRHSRATSVQMIVRVAHRVLTIDVRDNGVGFTRPVSSGHGLANIAERVAETGGVVSIDSDHGSGTRVLLTIPLSSELKGKS